MPLWAERAGRTTWHPHHIAERYGLFTIILLGETVLAATDAVRVVVETEVNSQLIVISVAGLVMLAAMWWLYFSDPAGPGLRDRRNWSYFWGYGHFVVYVALAALGAGLDVAVASSGTGHDAVGTRLTVATVAVPVALFLLALRAVHNPTVGPYAVRTGPLVLTVLAVAIAAGAAERIGVASALLLVAGAVFVLLATVLRPGRS